jgi:excisionase family DNA binding protein
MCKEKTSGAAVNGDARESQAALGPSRGTVYKIIQDEELPYIRLGRRVLIPTVALQALLETVAKVEATDAQVC